VFKTSNDQGGVDGKWASKLIDNSYGMEPQAMAGGGGLEAHSGLWHLPHRNLTDPKIAE